MRDAELAPAVTPGDPSAMIRRLRTVLLATAFVAAAGSAAARDYVVVGSTDPAFTRGQSLESGVRLNLTSGRSLTLMHASGDVVRIKGAAGGVVLPVRKSNQAEADRLAILRVMVTPAPQQRVGDGRMARTRAGICPPAETLTTLDAMVQVHEAGCKAAAAQALEAWISRQTPSDA